MKSSQLGLSSPISLTVQVVALCGGSHLLQEEASLMLNEQESMAIEECH